MNDLAERLNSVGATCDCADVDSLDWRDHFELCPLRLLDEAIAALTPVLPDDVKSLVSSLNNSPSDLYGVVVCAKFREAADMLERLAREQEYYETGCRVECDRNKELQQRIAELEEKINLAHDCLNNRNEMILSMKAENEALQQRIAELEARCDELEGTFPCPTCGTRTQLLGVVSQPVCYCPDESCAWSSWLNLQEQSDD